MFSEGSHGDVYKFFVSVFLDDVDHLLRDVRLSFKFEGLIAVSIVKDHLIYFDRNSLHFLNLFLLLNELPEPRRKEKRTFLDHGILIPEIAREEYTAHVASKKYHGSTRNMFGIEEGKLHL